MIRQILAFAGTTSFALPAALWIATPSAHATGTGDKHVLMIGIDGVRTDALHAASTPNLDALVASGAVTWDAVAGGPADPSDPAQQATSSGPGWSSFLTGVWADRHGVTSNGNYAAGNFIAYPHFFQRVRDAFPAATLSSIVQWHPINQNMLVPYPGLATFTQNVANSGQAVEDAAVAHLSSADPDVLFLHFDDVDHAGHASGFNATNPPYLQAIEETDAHIGNVLTAVQNRPNYAAEDWLVLVSTDHGGTGTSHGGQSAGERAIWIIASGGDVANHVFSEGPGHTALARTALHHLGIALQPAWGFVDAEPFGYASEFASDPTPAVGAAQVGTQATLSWLGGADATAHRVYFGTQPALGPADFRGSQAATSFDPGTLGQSTTYFWRIDTVTNQGVKVGDLWSFETVGSLLDELVLRLEFEGDTLDLSGRDNHPTVAGTPTFAAGAGGLGQGLAFDGSGDHLTLGNAPDTNFGVNADFSVALWVRSTGWSSDPALLANKNWVSGSNTGWIIACEGDGSSWQWNYKGTSAPRLDFDAIGPIADGAWHHLVVTHDRDGDAVFYQDGAIRGSIELAGTGNVSTGLATAIGQDGTLTYGVDLLATLDDVGIWRRVLGASEVLELMASGFPDAPGTGFCFGDTGCPCGNDDPSGTAGCVNSTGSGAALTGSGSPSVSADDLVLDAAGFPAGESGLFFMGAGVQAPVTVGDGLACTGGLFRFFPSSTSTGGVLTLESPVAGAPPGQITAGDTRHFQAWARDVLCGPPPSPCPSPCGNNSTVSSGYSVTFVP